MTTKPTRLSLLLPAFAILLCQSASAATTWLTKAGGDPDGLYAAGTAAAQAYDFNWTWNVGTTLTGTGSITRTGAGVHYETFESHYSTIDANNGSATPAEYSNSAFAVTNGGVNGSYHFLSEGDLGRATNDAGISSNSVTVYTIDFDSGMSAPQGSLLSIFDGGAVETNGLITADGPYTYQLSATFQGSAVATNTWTPVIAYPYSTGNAATTTVWDSSTSTLTVNNMRTSNSFPHTIVYLDTGTTTFDHLTLTATAIPADTFGIGLGYGGAPIPEPSAAALGLVCCAGMLSRRRRA